MRDYLHDRGITAEALARVQAPAGVDLGEVEPGEIGVAVLAELVALKGAGGLRASVPPAPAYEEARDPVCGMTVDRNKTPHRSVVDGRTVYFCGAGCKAKFDADPDVYLDPARRQAAPMAHAGHHHHH